jgi:REP element-mobilizing transposase RayT
MKSNSFNAEHVHTLIDLPTNKSIEEVMHLLKGSSSHWINEQRLLSGKFSWGRGYGSFSVSHSLANQVVVYLADQERHHRKQIFSQELEILVKKHGLEWHDR